MEQYFLSCRRLLSFGRCSDQFYSAIRSNQYHDPVIRSTLVTAKAATSLQMFADHVLWLDQIGLINVDKNVWLERVNKLWLFSTAVNLLRDFYEFICVVQQKQSCQNHHDECIETKKTNKLMSNSPLEWVKKYPKLSCDVVKNVCDFCIPYACVKKVNVHPALIASLGIISTTSSIMQVYDQKYRLSPL